MMSSLQNITNNLPSASSTRCLSFKIYSPLRSQDLHPAYSLLHPCIDILATTMYEELPVFSHIIPAAKKMANVKNNLMNILNAFAISDGGTEYAYLFILIYTYIKVVAVLVCYRSPSPSVLYWVVPEDETSIVMTGLS